jgi:hypothetical protein
MAVPIGFILADMVAVANCPLLTGARAGRPFFKAQAKDGESTPLLLNDMAAQFSIVLSALQNPLISVRVFDQLGV